MSGRKLRDNEIAVLEGRGCRAEDWSRVEVAEDFSPGDSFHRVFFSGDVRLGVYAGDVAVDGGPLLPTGVTASKLHNVVLGDNCRVHASTLADVLVEDGVVVDHVAELAHRGGSAFGNGLSANVLTEDGARSVRLWRRLSAQLAHLLCHFKGTPAAERLERLIDGDVAGLASARSFVGRGSVLLRCGALRNVHFGPGAAARGVAGLRDCYLEGGPAPALLGEGVSAEGCVFLSASRVSSGVRLEHCLVGEGTSLEQALFAEHTLFFANSRFKLGEAASVMAGPFAESHHRATLVLTCQCSFTTFGSGSNASNHHFKLGPRHGGVLRRGTRCGSGSYLFWPADVGAFSTVVGRHMEHLETVDFPFSLILSGAGGTVLVPGVNMFGIGAYRDAAKWRSRDRRAGVPRPLDLVNAAVLSPYTMQFAARGLAMLRRSEAMEGDLRHGGAVIPAHRIAPGVRLYESGLLFYVGGCLLRYTKEKAGVPTAERVAEAIRELTDGPVSLDGGGGNGLWRDWGGMLLSDADARRFIADVESGVLADGDAVRRRLEEIHAAYGRSEAEWAAVRWRREYGLATAESVGAFYEKWRQAVRVRHECMVKDAGKEFTPEMAYGFGVEESAKGAFARIRGAAEDEALVGEAAADRDAWLALAETL